MKIEIEKPVIPQFLADWIENIPEYYNVRGVLDLIGEDNAKDILEWCRGVDNYLTYKTLVTAFLYGYEIEQPLYQVIFFKDEDRNWLTFLSKEGNFVQTIKRENADCLTEQEIKDIDERFWPFAERVKVE